MQIADKKESPERVKRRYRRPALVRYGSVKQLTQATSRGASVEVDFFGWCSNRRRQGVWYDC